MSGEREYQLNNDWQKSVVSKPISYDFAEDLMNFCILYPTLIMINSFFNSGISLYTTAFIPFIITLVMTINRRKVKRVYIYALIQLAILLIVAFTPLTLLLKIEMLLITIVSTIISIRKLINNIKRVESKNDSSIKVGENMFIGALTVIMGAAIIYFTYLVSVAVKANEMLFICLASLTVLVICFIIYTNKVGAYRLIDSNNNYNSFTDKIKKFNLTFASYTAIFGLVTALLTFCIVYFTGLGRVDNAIINMFSAARQGETIKPTLAAEIENSNSSLNLHDLQTQQTPLLLLILGKIFMVIMWIAIAIIILITALFLIRLIFGLVNKFRKHINEETISVFSFNDIKNMITNRVKKFRINNLLSGSSNNLKIRRLYYNLVKGYLAEGVKIYDTDTPADIEDKIVNYNKKEMNTITHIYEEARYGYNDCDKNKVDKIKIEMKKKKEKQ